MRSHRHVGFVLGRSISELDGQLRELLVLQTPKGVALDLEPIVQELFEGRLAPNAIVSVWATALAAQRGQGRGSARHTP